MRPTHSAIVFLLGAFVFLTGCGPKVKLNPEFDQGVKIVSVALLPPQTKEGVRPERLNYIQSALREELESRGYLVLDSRAVAAICQDSSCPGRQELVSKYGVQGFAQLTLSADSRNNFVAGYYNVLSGELALRDAQFKDVVTVEHPETESGGLLFNSGQVFQGLKSTADNFKEAGFSNLANKFTSAMVLKLPRSQGGGQLDAVDITVSGVNARSVRPQVYEICADSQPRLLASLLVNRQRTTLRETTPGHYCGIYNLQSNFGPATMIAVEVRSPYGSTAMKDVPLAVAMACDFAGKIKLKSVNGEQVIALDCSPGTSQTVQSCLPGDSKCSVQKLLVYRSAAEEGPFEKIGEIKTAEWRDRTKRSGSAFYQVVAVGREGSLSLPISPATSE